MIKRYKTALITGAANGIGSSILKKLSNYNDKCFVTFQEVINPPGNLSHKWKGKVNG